MVDKYIRKQDAVNVVANTAKIVASFNYQYAIDALSALTPADVAPVVHGRWINGRCNKCGEHAPFWAMVSTYYTSNFCPNCGAKMRGVQDE